LAVLTALNVSVDGDGDDKVSFNIFGTNKSICIDKAKLREAIVISDIPVVERQASADDNKIDMPVISTDATEEEYLELALQYIGDVKKTDRNTLSKDSFIKVFKYTGDFAKLKNKTLKSVAQENRSEYFNMDHKLYLDSLKATINDEEKAYEASANIMFDKLSISQACFEKTQ
jgi:hypothetical protein